MAQNNRKYHINKTSNAKDGKLSGTVIEAEQPLSKSLVWKLQADFYANQGPEAWIKGIVPQYITTNPYIASLYAKTVFGYCRDLASCKDYDRDTTLYIIELAAGVGRFTHAFLRSFLQLLEHSSLKGFRFKYLLTDLAERNVTYWRSHNRLKPYFDCGILDCAVFDMTKDDTLTLQVSGEVLCVDQQKSPLILFANYTFDSLPQDSFYVNSGELYEGLITIASGAVSDTAEDRSILAGLEYDYTDRQIDGHTYYEEANMNAILEHYKACLEDTAFSMPITALRCITRLRRIFKDELLLLSTDKGYRNTQAMMGCYHPFLSKHGSISLTVNFHAFELYFKGLGGKAIHSLHEHENVTMSLFLLGKRSHTFTETALAYQDIIEGIGPDEFYTMKKAIVPQQKSLTTKELLTFLRFTLWDFRTFLEFYNTLLERIQDNKDFPKDELITTLYKVWENYFPIGEEGDLAYCLGTLFGYYGYDRDALRLFQTSLELYGEDAAIYYEAALCHYNLQEYEEALQILDKSLLLDPAYDASKELKGIIEEMFSEA